MIGMGGAAIGPITLAGLAKLTVRQSVHRTHWAKSFRVIHRFHSPLWQQHRLRHVLLEYLRAQCQAC